MIFCSKCGDNCGPFILLRGPEVFLCEDCWEKRKEDIYETARDFAHKENLYFLEREKNDTASLCN